MGSVNTTGGLSQDTQVQPNSSMDGGALLNTPPGGVLPLHLSQRARQLMKTNPHNIASEVCLAILDLITTPASNVAGADTGAKVTAMPPIARMI